MFSSRLAVTFFFLLGGVLSKDFSNTFEGRRYAYRSHRGYFFMPTDKNPNVDQVIDELEDGRLPDALYPVHYNLVVRPDIYTEEPPFINSGQVDIFFTVRNDTNQIILNSNQLTVVEGSITLQNQDPDQPAPSVQLWGLVVDLQFLIINLDGDLQAGETYKLGISFFGTLSTATTRQGIYYDTFTQDGNIRYVVGSQLQSIYTRNVFPCFDEPQFKATFNVSMARRLPYEAIGNGRLLGSQELEDGWIQDTFETTPRMSCYLLAFVVVADYRFIETETSTGTISRLWVREEALPAAQFGSEILTPITEYFEEYTAYPNVMPIINHVLMPNHRGAMENWGLIIYGESIVLWDEQWFDVVYRKRTGDFISHELAHFWWGNLVTCQWWTDTWLNEGFSSFFEAKSLGSIGWETDDMIYQEAVRTALRNDIVGTVQPVRPIVTTPFEASDVAFTASAYWKGSSVLRMIETVLSPQVFQRAVQKYLQTYQFENVVTDDLWDILSSQAAQEGITKPDGSPLDFKELFDVWVMQPGFPLVRAIRNYATGALSLAQTHFNPDDDDFPPSEFNYLWNVPINIYSENEINSTLLEIDTWIEGVPATVIPNALPLDPSLWYLVNPGSRFFYRVQYDTADYTNIARQLVQDHERFDVETRAALLDDTFTLARSEILQEVQAFELTSYLGAETEGIPWLTFDSFLDFVDRILGRDSDTYPLLTAYIEALIRPNYVRKGWQFDWTESIYQTELQQLAVRLACKYDNINCRFTARTLFSEWKESTPENNPVVAALRPAFYCTAIRIGDSEDWEAVYERYTSEGTPQLPFDAVEKQNLLSALSCSSSSPILENFLDNMLFDSDYVQQEDTPTAILQLADSPEGRNVVWQYLNENWRNLAFPENVNVSAVLNTVVEGFANEEDQFSFIEFVARYPPETEEEEAIIRSASDIIDRNGQWLDIHLEDLRNFLEQAISSSKHA